MVASAQSPSPGQSVVASVDVTKTVPPISAYVYNRFSIKIYELQLK